MSSHNEENEHSDIESDEDIYDCDDNIDDWDEIEVGEEEPTQCLFCDKVFTTIDAAVEHLSEGHHIDLSIFKGKFHMDQYSYIKMINYIRSSKVTAEQLLNTNDSAWSDDAFLKPVVVDSWLMFDFEDLAESNQKTTSSEGQRCVELERQLKEKDATIEQLLFQISEMQGSFRKWVDKTADGIDEEQRPEQNGECSESGPTTVAAIPMNEDQSYFSSYSHFDIHHEMLSDSVRTDSYRDAILKNKNLFNGKTAMDVGCGTSILSMFSTQAGAKKVIAIDQSDIIYHAKEIAKKNQQSNIEFVKGRLENISLPLENGEKVDIIISEWMGYFLLFEGMLDSVIYARDKYLKVGGSILPNRCTISIVGLGDEQRHREYIAFWNDVYGFDMGVMQPEVLREAVVEVCRGDCVISEPNVVADLNIATVDYNYPNFKYDFNLKITKTGKFTAFVGYFDTFFELENVVAFTTGPHAKPTHWKQVVFYVKDPVHVNAGDIVSGQFECRRGKHDARAICVKITAFKQKFYYNLN